MRDHAREQGLEHEVVEEDEESDEQRGQYEGGELDPPRECPRARFLSHRGMVSGAGREGYVAGDAMTRDMAGSCSPSARWRSRVAMAIARDLAERSRSTNASERTASW